MDDTERIAAEDGIDDRRPPALDSWESFGDEEQRRRPSYTVIHNLWEEDKVSQLDEPLHVTSDVDAWDDLKSFVGDEFHTFLHAESLLPEDPYNLISGTCNLINALVQRHNEGKPVDTLLYTDKAGRLAAYLLNICWDTIMQKIGTDQSQFPLSKPQIRFINSGREDIVKFQNQDTLQALGEVYRQEDFAGEVMIVDDFVSSGMTIKRTMRAIFDAGYLPKHLEGMAQLQRRPEWYSADAVKGVREPDYISEGTRQEIVQLSEELLNRLKKLLAILGNDGVRWLMLLPADELDTEIDILLSQNQKEALEKLDIDLSATFLELLTQCRERLIQASKVLNYLSTAGEFISRPPTHKQLEDSTHYRAMLKLIAEEAFRRGLVEIDGQIQAGQEPV